MSMKQVQKAFSKFKLNVKQESIKAIFTLMDLEENRKLSKKIFKDFLEDYFNENDESLAKSMFLEPEKRYAGILKEINHYLQNKGKGISLKKFFSKNDMEDDGDKLLITEENFVYAMEKIFDEDNEEWDVIKYMYRNELRDKATKKLSI
jgi:hypothetical protein